MHVGARKYKYQMLAQSLRFLECIAEGFLDVNNGFLLIASFGDHVIGGVLFLEWNGTLYYKFNASVPGDLAHRPNDLLMWTGIEHAVSTGCQWLDLGLSD